MTRLAIVVLVVVVLAHPALALAQSPSDSGFVVQTSKGSRLAAAARAASLGLELGVLVPRGDFSPGKAIAVGYGVRGGMAVGPRNILDVGAGFRSVEHGSRTIHDTLEMRNMLRTLTVSGRFIAPLRYARPYVGGSVGGAYFGTETMAEECCDEDGDTDWVFRDIRRVHIRPTASARVGILVDVWSAQAARSSSVLSLDLGLEDHFGRRQTYQIDGDGPILHTGTSHRVYSIGLSFRSR